MQSPKVLASIGEGSKSIRADLGRRGHQSPKELTSVGVGMKSFIGGQGPSDLTEDSNTTSNEPG